MTACGLYLIFVFLLLLLLLLLFPLPPKKKSWPSHNLFLKSIDPTKIICKTRKLKLNAPFSTFIYLPPPTIYYFNFWFGSEECVGA